MRKELLSKLVQIEREYDIVRLFGEPDIQHLPPSQECPVHRLWRYRVVTEQQETLDIYCLDQGNGWLRIIATELS